MNMLMEREEMDQKAPTGKKCLAMKILSTMPQLVLEMDDRAQVGHVLCFGLKEKL